MDRERAEKIVEFLADTFSFAVRYKWTPGNKQHLVGLLTDDTLCNHCGDITIAMRKCRKCGCQVEMEEQESPQKVEPVYRTAEYLAAALVVRACPPEQVSEGARLFNDFLAMIAAVQAGGEVMDEIEKLLTDTLAAEVRKLKAEVERLRRELGARVYYQNIVYAVCRAIDEIDGAKPGTGIVCGTLETPSDQVPRRMQALVDEMRRYRSENNLEE